MPTNWVDWSNGSGTRVTGLAPQPFAVTITGGAGTENGIYQSLLGRISTGWHVIEVDVTLVSGAFTAAGAYLDWDGGGTGISFVSDLDVNGVAPGIGTTGRLYKFRKLVQATAGTTYGNLYAMSHWSGFGSNASANSITWHRCAVRAASQAEIEARQATTDLVTTNANVATNTSVIATNTSAITTHSSQLSAMYGGYNSNLVPNSNFARGMEGWTGYAGGFVQGGPDPSVGIYSYSAANGAYVQSAEFPVYASGVVTFSLNAGGANLVGAYAVIAYYNSSHAFISHGTFITITTGIGYPRYTLTDTAPSGAAYARVQVGDTSHTSGFFLFYKVKVENGSTATPWTDERTPEGISAAVVTNTSAVATINDAAAFWETIVSAGGGDLAAVRLKAGTGGSYIELISTVLRLANVSNGAVIEVMRAVSGEAFFSRPISSDSASRRLTIGPGYGVSGQEVVLWFGPVATAPSSQSRTNGYFALGTDGKIYFGSADAGVATAPLTVSFSPTSVNTTHTTNTPLSQAITATPAGGSGTYTYVWALGDILSGNTPTLTNRYSATVTLGCTHTAVGTIDGNISCTVTDTVTGKSVTKYFGYYSEGTGGGTGAGAGGGLPP